MVGGRDRDRTGDPLLAKQVLSQLSYTPIVGYSNHFPLLTPPPQPLVLQKALSCLLQAEQIQCQLSSLVRAARMTSLGATVEEMVDSRLSGAVHVPFKTAMVGSVAISAHLDIRIEQRFA